MAAKALTSKALKTNNLGGFMEVKSERIAEIIRKVDGNHSMGAGALADAIMAELEKDRELSDLEIVQKALDNTGLELRVGKDWLLVCGEDEYSGDDALEVYYKDWAALLTWAKQTIGGGVMDIEQMKKELAELRAYKEAAENQEPIRWALDHFALGVGTTLFESEQEAINYSRSLAGSSKAIPLYANPIPAEKPVTRQDVIDVLLSTRGQSEGVTADAILGLLSDKAAASVPDAIQLLQRVSASTVDKPAVAVPKNFQDAIDVLKANLRDKDRGVKACGIHDNDRVRDALNTILSAPSHSQQSEG